MRKLFLILIALLISITLQSQTSARFIDKRDGQVYKAVKIGDQWWMAENLNYDTTGGYCYSDDCGTYAGTYGRLYVWNTAMGGSTTEGARGICPEGWHMPTNTEWTTLINFLGEATVAGGKLKTTGTTYWTTPNLGATNESNFSALPGGYRFSDGSYVYINYRAFFHSSTEEKDNAWLVTLYYNTDGADQNQSLKTYGNSIRCLKDEPFDFSMLYDDFETGAVSTDWDGGNSQVGGYRTVVGDASKDGDYGLDIGMTGLVSGYGYSYLYYYYTDNPQPEIWVRFWVKIVDATAIATQNAANRGWFCTTFNKDNSDTDFSPTMYKSSGTVYWRGWFGGTAIGDPMEVELGKWYEWKYRVKLDGANDTVQVWIDKSSQWLLAGSYANDAHPLTETIAGYYPNGPSQYNECIIYIDNFGVYIADPGDFPDDSPSGSSVDTTRTLQYPFFNKVEYKKPRIIK